MNDLSRDIRAYMYQRLNGFVEYNGRDVPILPKPSERTDHPYITVRFNAFTDDGTKDSFGGYYEFEVGIHDRHKINRGGQDQVDDIANLVLNRLRVRKATADFTEDQMYIFKQTFSRIQEDDDGQYEYFSRILTFQAWSLSEPESYSAEAQSVINRLSATTLAERTAIATYVDTEVANGNWDLIDDVFLFSIGEINAIGFKGTETENSGAIFGSRWMDTSGGSFNTGLPFHGSDTSISRVSDTFFGIYVYEGSDASGVSQDMIYDGASFADPSTTAIRQDSSDDIQFRQGGTTISTSGIVPDNSYIAALRISNSLKRYVNLAENESLGINVNNRLTDVPMKVGNSTAMKFSAYVSSKAVGFDYTAHYNALNTLISELQ